MTDEAEAIVASWSANAEAWTRAVREGRIASRRTVTDAAILAAVRRRRARRVLDLGCGEGWLGRALSGEGVEVLGTDAAPELVARAAEAGGTARCLDYAAIAADPARLGTGFDAFVCNFSLLDDRVGPLLAALPRIAGPGAGLVVQTLHPLAAGPPYADGWRVERFETFGEGGWTEMPWLFRTLASWVALLDDGGWRLRRLEEPRAGGAELPASLLLTAERG